MKVSRRFEHIGRLCATFPTSSKPDVLARSLSSTFSRLCFNVFFSSGHVAWRMVGRFLSSELNAVFVI